MKQINEMSKMTVSELSQEDLQSISGGSWWEVRVEPTKVVFIFHLYDDGKPAECIKLA